MANDRVVLTATDIDDGAQVGNLADGGALLVSMASKLAGEDLTADRLMVECANAATRLTGVSGDQTVKATPGYLHSIIVGKSVDATTITVKDGSTTKSVITCAGTGPVSIPQGYRCDTSIIVNPGSTSLDLTVVYR